jgi:hypothetical protein
VSSLRITHIGTTLLTLLRSMPCFSSISPQRSDSSFPRFFPTFLLLYYFIGHRRKSHPANFRLDFRIFPSIPDKLNSSSISRVFSQSFSLLFRQEIVSTMSPATKFLAIKTIVFFTYWQELLVGLGPFTRAQVTGILAVFARFFRNFSLIFSL